MTPEAECGEYRYALLANGANFACEVLQALLRKRFPPALLVLPEYAPAPAADEFAGFGLERPRPRLLRLAASIPLAYSPAERQAECARLIRRLSIDFLLVACWPYLIAPELVGSAARAALNLHPSLLPRYRGADPVTRQIELGETRLGVTLHLLSQRFDAGDIVAQASLPRYPAGPDRETLERDAARLGCDLFVDAIKRYDAHWRPRPQSSAPQPRAGADASARGPRSRAAKT